MNINKKLKEEVKYTDEKILESGKELKEKLIREYCNASEKIVSKPIYKRKSVIITLCCVLICLLVVGICLPIVLKNDGPIVYLKENEVSSSTTLEIIYKDIDTQINENNYVVMFPTIIQDSVSGDTLYYRVKIESKMVFPYGDIYFVANEYYILFEEEYKSDCKWNNYNVVYTTLNDNHGDIPSIQVAGCLEYNKLRIYFNYTDIDLGEPVTPVTFLDSLLII